MSDLQYWDRHFILTLLYIYNKLSTSLKFIRHFLQAEPKRIPLFYKFCPSSCWDDAITQIFVKIALSEWLTSATNNPKIQIAVLMCLLTVAAIFGNGPICQHLFLKPPFCIRFVPLMCIYCLFLAQVTYTYFSIVIKNTISTQVYLYLLYCPNYEKMFYIQLIQITCLHFLIS